MAEPTPTTDHPIGAPGDFPDGVGVAVTVAGLDLLVVRDGEAFHALSNRCPHKGARFALDGPGEARGADSTTDSMTADPPAATTADARCRLTADGDEKTVACPWHGLPFDVETGACPVPRFGLGTFEVVADGDVVSVRL